MGVLFLAGQLSTAGPRHIDQSRRYDAPDGCRGDDLSLVAPESGLLRPGGRQHPGSRRPHVRLAEQIAPGAATTAMELAPHGRRGALPDRCQVAGRHRSHSMPGDHPVRGAHDPPRRHRAPGHDAAGSSPDGIPGDVARGPLAPGRSDHRRGQQVECLRHPQPAGPGTRLCRQHCTVCAGRTGRRAASSDHSRVDSQDRSTERVPRVCAPCVPGTRHTLRCHTPGGRLAGWQPARAGGGGSDRGLPDLCGPRGTGQRLPSCRQRPPSRRASTGSGRRRLASRASSRPSPGDEHSVAL